MNIKSDMTTYFGKAISGFVANKYVVSISNNLGFGDNLRFYASSVSLPYETLNTSDDIYVSRSTLAKPKNVISVQTHSELTITFRVDATNKIVKGLENIFDSNHNLSKFETSKNSKLVNVVVDVYNGESKVNSYNYSNCTIHHMESFEMQMADRKFKEYKATFICNRYSYNNKMNNNTYSSVSQSKLQVSCQRLRDDMIKTHRAYKSAVDELTNTGLLGDARDAQYVRVLENHTNIFTTFYKVLNAKCLIGDEIILVYGGQYILTDGLRLANQIDPKGVLDGYVKRAA